VNPRWQRIEELFAAATDLPEAERDAFLDEACAANAELRAELASLLRADARGAEPLRAAVGAEAERVAAASGTMVGQRLGPYRLIKLIGAGGMGAVYLAERDDDQYRTQVAIKILDRTGGGADAVARFRDERQILATLDHPSIVRLLDGGTADDGRPYLVMEHVVGEPVSAYAERHALSVRARVELFRRICAAVQVAHQHLVVHRDLKPGNILVTEEGLPKLLDFGIAKLLDADAGAREARTRTGMQLFTPEYASPEQARGAPASTATDIYSLGAVLYHLFTGAPPHRLGASSVEALRVILEVDAPRPSTVAPPTRRRALAGDLDHIVSKALRKEPAARYGSVEQLSQDLGRYLDGLPVEARVGSWRYRAGKLVRRNRALVAATAVVLATLIGATVVSLGQARRADASAREARQEFDAVRRLAGSLLFEVDDAIRDLEGATAARDLIVRRALEYLDFLAQRAGGDADLARDLAAAYLKIGDIQGSDKIPNLGRIDDAMASYAKARAIIEALPSGDPRNRWALAQLHLGLEDLNQMTGDFTALRAHGRAAAELVAGLPASLAIDRQLVERGHINVDYADLWDGDLDGAQAESDRALALAEEWARGDPSPEPRYWIAVAHEMLAQVRGARGDSSGAAVDGREAVALLRQLVEREPAKAPYRTELARALILLDAALADAADAELWHANEGDARAAEQALDDAGAELDRLIARDAHDSRAQMLRATVDSALGAGRIERDDAAAIAALERGRARFAELSPATRAAPFTRQLEYFTHCALAHALARVGRAADARAEAEVGLAMVPDGGTFTDRFHQQMCRALVARAWRALGEREAAAELASKAVVELRRLIGEQPAVVRPTLGLIDLLAFRAEVATDGRCRDLESAAAALRSWPGARSAALRSWTERLSAVRASCP
jgi:hypothetical protein